MPDFFRNYGCSKSGSLLSLCKELVGMSVESIISLGVVGWLALGMILMGLGIW
ncbi:protein of unknown function [Candidatus Nitrospira inopinata]|jgi:hypothetical protein|uniref:Uncharacterized protein n=1 Tax=Candidatus Nitrospira inopinata TaxID=1715989 RepID=A0A0S4KV32_9BACT|nr:protein of unknown function [Candidatus Nitrospira inopinata]